MTNHLNLVKTAFVMILVTVRGIALPLGNAFHSSSMYCKEF